MKRLMIALLATTVSISVLSVPNKARAEDGAVAAGVAGGLLGGLFLGSALAPRPYYRPAPSTRNPSRFMTNRPSVAIGGGGNRIGMTIVASGAANGFGFAIELTKQTLAQ